MRAHVQQGHVQGTSATTSRTRLAGTCNRQMVHHVNAVQGTGAATSREHLADTYDRQIVHHVKAALV